VDTYSGVLFASTHTAETTKHALGHLLGAFATFGIAKSIRTDNGPTYKSNSVHYGTLLTMLECLTILKAKPL
jgi:transposase InsO family protein